MYVTQYRKIGKTTTIIIILTDFPGERELATFS